MYTPCINTNQQTNDILYDIFVYFQAIAHREYTTRPHAPGGTGGVNTPKIRTPGEPQGAIQARKIEGLHPPPIFTHLWATPLSIQFPVCQIKDVGYRIHQLYLKILYRILLYRQFNNQHNSDSLDL